jgi:hypothetical protein
MVDHLHPVAAERHQLELGPLLCEPLDRRGQLDLFHAFRGGEHRDPLALESP